MSLHHASGKRQLTERRGEDRPHHFPLNKILTAEKFRNGSVNGTIKEHVRSVILAQLPINDQRHAVGKNDSLFLIMRDKNRRDAKLFL